jgi:hypothetical protein
MAHSQSLIAGCVALTLVCMPAAMAQQSASNAEACTRMTWGYLKSQGYEYGAINTCSYPVAIWFKTRGGRTIEATVQPGQGFRTGLTIDTFESERRKTGWIGAVCRAGEVPSLSLSDGTWNAVLNGDYQCQKS